MRPPNEPPPASGPDLLFADTVGGNTKLALIGTISPADVEGARGTLQLLAKGMPVEQYPLVNDPLTRGLLRRHHCQMHALQQKLALVEDKFMRGVSQVEDAQRLLPNKLADTTERLQALVDTMQQEAAGKSTDRQTLMAEVMNLRTQLNAAVRARASEHTSWRPVRTPTRFARPLQA